MKFVLFLIKFIVFKPIIRPAIGHGLRFYRAMLYIRGTSHEPVSVRLSVRHRSVFYRNETAERIELGFGM